MDQAQINSKKQFIKDYLAYAKWCLSLDEVSHDELAQKLRELAATLQPSLDAVEFSHWHHQWQSQGLSVESLIDQYLNLMSDNVDKEKYESLLNDARFLHPAWKEKPFFKSTLSTYQKIIDVASASPLNPALDFHRQRFIEFLAPTNSIFFNPEVMERALETDGVSLQRGLNAIEEDIDRDTGILKIRQVDKSQYQLGKNIAVSKGSVVFENELIELLFYPSTQKQSYTIPLLIVPPWINKFYILDLDEKTSLVKYLNDRGFNVFMISWRNPRATQMDYHVDDYAEKGIRAAIAEITKLQHIDKVNIAAYCIAGTLISSLYAVSDDEFKEKIASITLLTTLLDFEESGDLRSLMQLDLHPLAQQYLDERKGIPPSLMGLTFQYLRPNALIWPYIIRHYFLGDKADSSAVMFWNSDGTQLTANVVKWLKENGYGENGLCKGNAKLLQSYINLERFDIESLYCVACEKDHIAPWHAVFSAIQQYVPHARFILATSGHIKGIIHNPDTARGYRVVDLSSDKESALKSAEKKEGSWWHDWFIWLSTQSGALIEQDFEQQLTKLRSAPGKYVLE